jgi:hypothetical protein
MSPPFRDPFNYNFDPPSRRADRRRLAHSRFAAEGKPSHDRKGSSY